VLRPAPHHYTTINTHQNSKQQPLAAATPSGMTRNGVSNEVIRQTENETLRARSIVEFMISHPELWEVSFHLDFSLFCFTFQ